MRYSAWVGVLMAGWASLAQAADPVEVKGKVDAVTVYRGEALVTRLLELPGPAGLREVVVSDLPENVLPGSIYAESADGVEVRSTRYRVRPVQQDVREEVRKLDQQIREVQDKLTANQRHTEVLTQNKAYLEKLEQFVAPTATVEMTKGVLNAETIQKLTEFVANQRLERMKTELQLSLEQRDLNEQLDLLKRQRQEVTGSSSRTAREAVVFVNLANAQGGRLRLRYLVGNANWTPSYNMRTDDQRAGVLVECNASIQQMSGEDWADVEMTLSTAVPSLVAKAPVLTPLSISLAPPGAPGGKEGKAVVMDEATQRGLNQRRQTLSNTRNSAVISGSNVAQQQAGPAQQVETQSIQGMANVVFDLNLDNLASQDSEMNLVAGQLQNWDLANRFVVTRKSATSRPKAAGEDLTVTYRLNGRTSLPSRSDRQLIQIAAMPMKAQFYKVAIPLLTNFVYEEAALANQGQMVLLAGPVSAYVAGQFVGHGQIPTVAIGEGFTVGFGIDSSLRVSRELVEKTENIQGGNRVVDFTYRLAIENFAASAVKVRLFDRLPQAKQADIKLSLVSTGQDLSADEAYRQGEHKKGILRWEVEVPAQSAGPSAKAIEYQFKLEYDKQMSIAGLAVANR